MSGRGGVRQAILLLALLVPSLFSGCAGLFGRDGCVAVLMGNPQDDTSLLRICDYAFELHDQEDAVVVRSLGVAPNSWRAPHLAWKDLAIEASNTSLRVAFQSRADASTGWDVPRGSASDLGPLNTGPIDLGEFITLCELDAGEHEVRFRLYQEAQSRWDDQGGIIEIRWKDVRDC